MRKGSDDRNTRLSHDIPLERGWFLDENQFMAGYPQKADEENGDESAKAVLLRVIYIADIGKLLDKASLVNSKGAAQIIEILTKVPQLGVDIAQKQKRILRK